MSALPRGAEAALQPLRDALRASADREAASLAAAAARDADAAIAAARAEAESILAAARADGEAAAQRDAGLRAARAQRSARETVLRARSAADSALDDAVAAAIAALDRGRGSAGLERRLRGRAKALLGPSATIEAAPGGGITATSGSRRIDASLPALAAEASEWLRRERS